MLVNNRKITRGKIPNYNYWNSLPIRKACITNVQPKFWTWWRIKITSQKCKTQIVMFKLWACKTKLWGQINLCNKMDLIKEFTSKYLSKTFKMSNSQIKVQQHNFWPVSYQAFHSSFNNWPKVEDKISKFPPTLHTSLSSLKPSMVLHHTLMQMLKDLLKINGLIKQLKLWVKAIHLWPNWVSRRPRVIF